MVFHQLVDDHVRARAAVEDIADDMQVIDGQLLDQVAKRCDQRVGHARLHSRGDEFPEIAALIRVGIVGLEQFINEEGIVIIHGLMDALARIFGRHIAADEHQPADGQFRPFLKARAGAALV